MSGHLTTVGPNKSYTGSLKFRSSGDSRMRASLDSTWRTEEVRHVGSDTLRRDFGASQLRGLAKKTKDGPQARRLLALAAIYDGATRTEAAMIGGVGLQIIRDWVLPELLEDPLCQIAHHAVDCRNWPTLNHAQVGRIRAAPLPCFGQTAPKM